MPRLEPVTIATLPERDILAPRNRYGWNGCG